MDKKISYHREGISVIWKPELCKHSGICVRMLPAVYHPKDKPWITAENATVDELIQQIRQCPSGALSYQLDEDKQ